MTASINPKRPTIPTTTPARLDAEPTLGSDDDGFTATAERFVDTDFARFAFCFRLMKSPGPRPSQNWPRSKELFYNVVPL
jgi:hypothetical protein